MATPPTFSSGAVLTAAQMNSVGLWKVASGSLSAATTNFQGCFTSDFRDYRIVIDSMGVSGTADFYIRLLQGASEVTGSTANNYWAFRGFTSGGAGADSSANTSSVIYTGATFTGTTNAAGQCIVDITGPQIAVKTILTIQTGNNNAGTYTSRNGMGSFDTTAIFDGFALKSLSAVTLSGNVTIYGYRN